MFLEHRIMLPSYYESRKTMSARLNDIRNGEAQATEDAAVPTEQQRELRQDTEAVTTRKDASGSDSEAENTDDSRASASRDSKKRKRNLKIR